MTGSPARFARREQVLWRATRSTVLLRRTDDDQFLRLEGSAAQMWLLLEEARNAAELADDLAPLYALPADEMLPGVEAGLAGLLESGLVEQAAT